MPQPPGYPKRAWAVMQTVVTVENGREVAESETVLAMTYESTVAELLIAKMRERESATTIVRSGLQPLPSSLLEILDEPTTPSTLLEEIANATVQDQG